VSTRITRRVPSRTVRTSDGATAHLPAVDLVFASALYARRCGGCSAPTAARGEYVISSRTTDTVGDFDVTYCSLACRARFVGGAL
jgi:hypothetical protein